MLGNLSVFDAKNLNDGDRSLLAGWRDAHKRDLLRAASYPAVHHSVAFGNHILNRDLQIGEYGAQSSQPFLLPAALIGAAAAER